MPSKDQGKKDSYLEKIFLLWTFQILPLNSSWSPAYTGEVNPAGGEVNLPVDDEPPPPVVDLYPAGGEVNSAVDILELIREPPPPARSDFDGAHDAEADPELEGVE